jgi:separase
MLFILFNSYSGHGSGSQYFPSAEVQKLRINACSILMGCSSGNQYTMGEFEPYGTILDYKLAGCPSVVDNLWDVADRDNDLFTKDFLKSWLNLDSKNSKNIENTDSSDICTNLIKARSVCEHSLNGSALVIYGMPLLVE